MWRAMNSLLVLRDQVNAIAPNRSTASDGLVGDAAHAATTSDHNPHYVAGVGDEIVTALDLTHDPDHGFDSYAFAEVLRQHRDARIKYVISNRRLFSSYATSSYPAWTWRPYSGTDPHTNHVHVSVLDAVISDTRTPWNLDGFGDNDMALSPAEQFKLHVLNYRLDAILHMRPTCSVPSFKASDGSTFPAITETNHLAAAVLAADDTGDPAEPVDLDALAAKVAAQVDVPTAAETAEAVADELHDRTAE